MDEIVKQGRLLFAMAITAFGAEHLICARFGQAVVPVIPWIPANPILAYLTGFALVAAGLSIAINRRVRLAAILPAILFLLCVLVLQISRVAVSPWDVGARTRAFETLAMCGAALTLAGTLPLERRYSPRWESAVNGLIKSGPLLFGTSSVVFGIDHFLVLGLIASLVPTWLPGGGLFWAYFTGAAFIAAGVSNATNWMARWAAALLGTMFLLWFLLLHAPRIVTFPRSHDPNEWSSAFIALGMCGGSWISGWRTLRELSAGVHRSEAVSLCHPVVPVFDSLAMITRDELLYQTADETPTCVIVRMPTPPSAGTLLARMRHRATQFAHS